MKADVESPRAVIYLAQRSICHSGPLVNLRQTFLDVSWPTIFPESPESAVADLASSSR
jgi:hypothetical protein